jgi:hypothetical protein
MFTEGVKVMNSAMMMERPLMGMPAMGSPAMGTMPMGGTGMAPNMVMVPRCTFTVEKCQGGMKVTCKCEDPNACAMVQNLCQMLAGGMCSMSCMLNGMVVCCCNLTMGLCKCEMTKDGCCLSCTSGDPKCGEMIQGCCDCIAACLKAGCTCCLMMSGTPVCCGC